LKEKNPDTTEEEIQDAETKELGSEHLIHNSFQIPTELEREVKTQTIG
jgi:hypothetical protein